MLFKRQGFHDRAFTDPQSRSNMFPSKVMGISAFLTTFIIKTINVARIHLKEHVAAVIQHILNMWFWTSYGKPPSSSLRVLRCHNCLDFRQFWANFDSLFCRIKMVQIERTFPKRNFSVAQDKKKSYFLLDVIDKPAILGPIWLKKMSHSISSIIHKTTKNLPRSVQNRISDTNGLNEMPKTSINKLQPPFPPDHPPSHRR